MMEIKKEMTIGEIVQDNPKAAEVMGKHGLHCIGCHVGLYETLEEGCKAHGMKDKQIELMVKEINESISEKKDSLSARHKNCAT